MTRPIALLSDFGVTDAFVGTMKAVILDLCPHATIFDLTHAIPRHDVRRGARVLARVAPYLPADCVTVAVVDPGVGSERRALVVSQGGRAYIGPDNGLLTPVLADAEVRVANNAVYWREKVSNTFHGRDIFAPLAAQVCRGVRLSQLGALVEDALRLPWPQAQADGDGWAGEVVDVDTFGNLQTNIALTTHHGSVLVAGEVLKVTRYYGEHPAGALLALVDSDGWLELAVNQGSAQERLGGLGVPVRWQP